MAAALNAPLDIVVVRKLGSPYNPELAMGAIGEGGVRSSTTTSSQRFASRKENSSPSNATSEPNWNGGRISCARGGGPPVSLHGRTAVIVDDGMATARVPPLPADARAPRVPPP